ncbi:hypothetical protein GGD63_005821 [Bradyrhizobium sp. cir1]|nr:hypothetical protein [Bradyrhizobium sp. cir1]MBB4373006.1 hypothetical protein [Bradyrhizobium sp. cir1]
MKPIRIYCGICGCELRQRRREDTGKGLKRSGMSTIRIEQGSELAWRNLD